MRIFVDSEKLHVEGLARPGLMWAMLSKRQTENLFEITTVYVYVEKLPKYAKEFVYATKFANLVVNGEIMKHIWLFTPAEMKGHIAVVAMAPNYVYDRKSEVEFRTFARTKIAQIKREYRAAHDLPQKG